MKNKIIILILMSLFAVSCAKETKKTSAKLKLNLAGITNLGSGIGLGGAILFGKSANGEQFGKIVSANEQDMDLPNGDWSFYAVMWANTTSYNIKDTAYCGKSVQNLNGTAATVSMTLSNAACADVDFSAGKHYTDGFSKIHFANFYMEECDDLGQSNHVSCLRDNQGSALSYRMVFKSYKKMPGAAVPFFSDEVLYSKCITAAGGTTLFNTGMEINFPSSKSAMPFVVSTEMFLGSTDCGVSVPEIKGVFTHTFQQGLLGESTQVNKNVPASGLLCSTASATEEVCKNYFGSWSGSCNLTENMVAAFLPAAECSGSSPASVKYIKQMVSIPKDFLCRNTSYGLSGGNVFPGGDGSIKRPYKICSEWQLNQIGEPYGTSSGFLTSSFKLMNDLDMNNADFNVAARPYCVGAASSIYKKHHNLNPIGQSSNGTCDSTITAVSFDGTFNGNYKTISHGRILVENSHMGFIRKLGSNGVVKNLNFVNLEVEGDSYVGGVAGEINGSNNTISNVNISSGYIEASTNNVGAIAGLMTNTNTINSVKVKNVEIKGTNKIGGLVGISNGLIEKSMFRGKIRQHTPMDGHIGGLIGEAGTGSNVNDSFSEGQIESALKWTGGITGINSGSITNAYSNMYLLSFYGNTAYIGGITADNTSGTITNVYSDGKIEYKDTPSASDGISANGNTPTSCISTSSSLSVSGCTNLTSVVIRQGSTLLSGLTSWKANVTSALPRLSWEFNTGSRVCLFNENLLSVADQVTAGKGTLLLPVIICTPDQLKDLAGTPVNRYIALGEDISIVGWTFSDLIPTFSGSLDGRRHSIYGLTTTVSGSGNIGIFQNNTGTISNLNIIGNKITHQNTGATGALAGVNSGMLKNIYLMGNTVQGIDYVGSAVGSNSGSLSRVFINQGQVLGTSYVGGITGSNEGTIIHSSANAGLSDTGNTNYFKFGGITGFNGSAGVVNQSSFGGTMNFGSASVAVPVYIGGLVGYNLGTIENAMTKNYTQLNVKNSSSVGGLVGHNQALIKKSLSLGKILYQLGVVPASSTIHQIAGVNSGTVESNVLYLENNVAGFVGSAQASSCSSTEMNISGSPAFLTTATPVADLLQSTNYSTNSGDTLKNLMPFTITSDWVLAYTNTCTASEYFNFYQSYDIAPSTGKRTVANLSDVANFIGYDIAYEADDPNLSVNVDRLYSYYKSIMYGTSPALTPPIWEIEDGRSPRLLQIND